MTLARVSTVAVLALSLAACATVKNARDRIVRRAPICADQTVQIYFEPQSTEVSKEGGAVLAAAAGNRRLCKVTAVEVLGLSSATGAADSNLELSKKRAEAVTAALVAQGLPAADFKLSAAGQAGATTNDGQARPLRRRVDVTLHQIPL